LETATPIWRSSSNLIGIGTYIFGRVWKYSILIGVGVSSTDHGRQRFKTELTNSGNVKADNGRKIPGAKVIKHRDNLTSCQESSESTRA
jgi:hypothetical protein